MSQRNPYIKPLPLISRKRHYPISSADDLSHDEALSNRVARLNLLDLGLQHLGIEIDEAINEEDLSLVVNA